MAMPQACPPTALPSHAAHLVHRLALALGALCDAHVGHIKMVLLPAGQQQSSEGAWQGRAGQMRESVVGA